MKRREHPTGTVFDPAPYEPPAPLASATCWSDFFCSHGCAHMQRLSGGTVDPAACKRSLPHVEDLARVLDLTLEDALALFPGSTPETVVQLRRAWHHRAAIWSMVEHVKPIFLFPEESPSRGPLIQRPVVGASSVRK